MIFSLAADIKKSVFADPSLPESFLLPRRLEMTEMTLVAKLTAACNRVLEMPSDESSEKRIPTSS